MLFGPPGAGKGTQAQLLVDRYDLTHVSSGDIFRHNLRQGTPLGLRAKEYMDRGELVPDDVVIDIMLDKIMSIHSDEGFILDGFPRSTRQAEELESALTARARNVDRVLHIDVPEDELVRRLSGRYVCRECQAPYTIANSATIPACERCGGELYQRDDDRPEAVQKRIDVYREETHAASGPLPAEGPSVRHSWTGHRGRRVREYRRSFIKGSANIGLFNKCN